MAAAPASFAFNAPFTVITPFTINGAPAISAMAFRSSTDLPPAGGSIFFRNGRPAASTSIATAKAPDFFTRSIFSRIVSRFHGFTVGTPMPPANAIASVAASITFGFVPSPVKATMPFSAQAETRTL